MAPTTPGTITLGSNNFQVLGGHTYTNAGNFFVSVGVNDDGGSQLSFRTNARTPSIRRCPGQPLGDSPLKGDDHGSRRWVVELHEDGGLVRDVAALFTTRLFAGVP